MKIRQTFIFGQITMLDVVDEIFGFLSIVLVGIIVSFAQRFFYLGTLLRVETCQRPMTGETIAQIPRRTVFDI